jgi:hypothetical protein
MYYLVICFRGWVKPRKTSARIAGILCEIRNEHIQNVSLWQYRYAHPLVLIHIVSVELHILYLFISSVNIAATAVCGDGARRCSAYQRPML